MSSDSQQPETTVKTSMMLFTSMCSTGGGAHSIKSYDTVLCERRYTSAIYSTRHKQITDVDLNVTNKCHNDTTTKPI